MATIILAYANFFVNEEIGYILLYSGRYQRIRVYENLNRRDIKKDK